MLLYLKLILKRWDIISLSTIYLKVASPNIKPLGILAPLSVGYTIPVLRPFVYYTSTIRFEQNLN